MRVKFLMAVALSLSLLVPTVASADEIDDIMSEIESEETSLKEGDLGANDENDERIILPEIGDEDQLAVFVLDRGFYFASDLGDLSHGIRLGTPRCTECPVP